MQSLPTWTRRYGVAIILVSIVVVLLGAYEIGYRVGPGVTISRVGTLSLTGLPKGTTIYIDESSNGVVKDGGTRSYELTPGSHMIIASASSTVPWSELVSVTSGQTVSVAPIFVPTNIKATSLTGDARVAALAAIASSTLPSTTTPLQMANGCVAISVQNNQVIADATNATGCTQPAYLCTGASCGSTIVFSPRSPLTTVIPYPGHDDALIVGFNDTLYALAIDPRSPQFFAPLLEGSAAPKAAVMGTSTLVVQIGSSVFTAAL